MAITPAPGADEAPAMKPLRFLPWLLALAATLLFFKDTALAMRRSFEDLQRRTGSNILMKDMSTALCEQFSNHGNITLEHGRQIWALVRRGPEAWGKIAALLEGRVTNKSSSKFKEIKSPALFQPMVTLDDSTVTALLDNVIQGKWDRKLFLA